MGSVEADRACRRYRRPGRRRRSNRPCRPQCLELLQSATEAVVTTGLVIAEAAYLIERELGSRAEALLFDSIANGSLRVLDLAIGDWERIGALITQYEELLPAGLMRA